MKRKHAQLVPQITEVPVPDVKHPPCEYDVLPQHEFTLGLIGEVYRG